MKNKQQLSPEEMSEIYFEFQAVMGVTKHMGGLRATEELIELCHINKDKYVLDVGCGLGRTVCYIAKKHGSKVVGVDISERMVYKSREKAKKGGVEDGVEFRVGDAQNLPIEDATFDAVISESLLAFIKDRQRAISEYVRVTKPGGYIGLNECIWVKTPPSGLTEYMYRIMGAKFPSPEGWKELLEGAGLKDVVARTYKISVLDQWANEIKQLDFREYLGAWYRFLFLLIKSPACRRFSKEALSTPKNIFDIFKYFGYGIYVGRK